MRWGLAALVAVALVAAFIWRGRGSDGADAAELVVVRRGALEGTVTATGSLAPASTVSLAWPSAGDVTRVDVALGQDVSAGEALVALDATSLTLEVEAAEAALDAARSSLAAAEASLADLQAGPDSDELERARLALDQAKDRRWASQSQRDATCGRVGSGGDETACNSAEASVRQAEASVRLAEMDLEALQAGPTQIELAQAQDKANQARSGLRGAEKRLADAQDALAAATIVAPITGTVTALAATAGQSAKAGELAVEISDLSSFEVTVSLDETDVSKAAVGQEAVIVADAFPDSNLAGAITSVAPVAAVESGVVLYPVVVHVDAGDAPVRAGMTVDVTLITSRVADALIVPRRAITSVGGRDFVTVVPEPPQEIAERRAALSASRQGEGGGRFRSGRRSSFPMRIDPAAVEGKTNQVAVTLGVTTDAEAQVLDGVAAGDYLLVAASSASSSQFGRPPGVRGFGGGFAAPIGRPGGP